MNLRLPALGPLVRLLAYGLLAALPVSVGAVNFFAALVLLAALSSREWWQACGRLPRQPVVLATLALLLLLCAGLFYSEGSLQDGWAVVAKYRKLLVIPMLLPFFQEDRYRFAAMRVFALSIFVTVLVSWTEFLGWTHLSDPAYGGPPGDAVFKMHIPQGTLFSLLVVLGICLAREARSMPLRVVYWAMSLVAALDIAWVMVGRTGKAILPVIALWALWETMRQQSFGPKFGKAAIAVGTVLILAATGWAVLNPHTMLGSVVSEIRKSQETGTITSQGIRLEFYRKAMQLMAERPLAGHGTGSVTVTTGRLAARASTEVAQVSTVNLHNEFMMWAVQLGWPGLAAVLMFFMALWRESFRQSTTVGMLLRGQWVVFATGCLFNSYLLDFAEGYAIVLTSGILLPL
ncbi:MAG: O-antigen ligase family protein [Betaproteobacteria bacterium]|nr:O-antigen ligase family protein [Betaproteobacteria bacterium]